MKTKDIATVGVSAALVFAVTALVSIPMPVLSGGEGYFNMGDVAIFLSAYLIGGWQAALAAAVGSSLSDLALSYSVYILPTFVIKGTMGLTVGLMCARTRGFPMFGAACAIGALIMASGYTVFEAFFYGGAAAIAGLPGNVLQGVVATVCSYALFIPVAKLRGVLGHQ
ncbi:MAG: ECF transporter S component [Oscillospiraceae bacterium]|jgi:uncharacterized membrane protein|nr:ECF transporter S component [Oscillospiraceae bacterium]